MNTTQFRSPILNDVYNEYFNVCYNGEDCGGWVLCEEEGWVSPFSMEDYECDYHYEMLWFGGGEFLPHPRKWSDRIEAMGDEEKQTLIDELDDPTRENPGSGARPRHKQSVNLTYQMFDYVWELLMTPDPAGDLVFKTYHDSLEL